MISESMINSYKTMGYDVIAERCGNNVRVVYTKYGSITGVITESELKSKARGVDTNAKVIIVESILG